MNRTEWKKVTAPLLLSALVGTGLGTAPPARAQEPKDNRPLTTAYAISDETSADVAPADEDAPRSEASAGPVRLARFAYVKGNVTWRSDEGAQWSNAGINLPLREGAQIWVTDGGRAEIQFDDGSVLRLGSGALVTMPVLYSDSEGEFTELKLNDGLATLRVKSSLSVFQVDTPLVSVKTKGPSQVRLGAGDGVEVAVRSGNATIEGEQGKKTMEAGDYLDLRDANTPYDLRNLPGDDNWDRFNQERDDILDGVRGESKRHLPVNIALVAGDLDEYGSWRNDPQYGYVWCPRVVATDWRPYHDGHWTWVNPYGWTWVSDEAWGWAPYHYGTWVSASYGWAWCPGPVTQYWSPAIVHFSEYEGRVAWCPLAPAEVRYPATLAIGFRGGNWSAFFSIGQAAVYYPYSANYCVARPFRTAYVNHVTYVRNVTNITNVYNVNQTNNVTSYNRFANSAEYFAANNNTYAANSRFVPRNARSAAGVSAATTTAFGGSGRYETVARGTTTYFDRGRGIAPPAAGQAPLAGPPAARPTALSLSPSRAPLSRVAPPAQTLNRSVFRAPVSSQITRASAPITPGGTALSPRLSGSGQIAATRGRAPGAAAGTPATPGREAIRSRDNAGNANAPTRTGTQTGNETPARRSGTGASASNPGGSVSRNRDDRSAVGRSDSGTTGGSSRSSDAAARARESLGVGTGRGRASGTETPGRSTDRSTTRPDSGGTRSTSPDRSTEPTRNSQPSRRDTPAEPTRRSAPSEPTRRDTPRNNEPSRRDPPTETPRRSAEPTRRETPPEPRRETPTYRQNETRRESPPPRERDSGSKDTGKKDDSSKDSGSRGRGRG